MTNATPERRKKRKFVLLARAFNVKTFADWYAITSTDVLKKGLGGLHMIKKYKHISHALINFYPEYNWDVRRFRKVPRNYWDSPQHQRDMFDSYAMENGITTMDGWYELTVPKMMDFGGGFLLRDKYGDSLATALETLYPEHDWDYGKFSKSPQGYWQAKKTTLKHFERIAAKYSLKHPSDWYNISRITLRENNAAGLCAYYPKSLTYMYPEYEWNWSLFGGRAKKTKQRTLETGAYHLFDTNA